MASMLMSRSRHAIDIINTHESIRHPLEEHALDLLNLADLDVADDGDTDDC